MNIDTSSQTDVHTLLEFPAFLYVIFLLSGPIQETMGHLVVMSPLDSSRL